MNLKRLLGLRPPPPPADEWERRYQRGYAGDASDIAEAGHFALVAAYLRAAAAPRPRIVDAGCGRGQLLHQIGRDELSAYYAFDVSETAVADARARAGERGLDPGRVVVGGFDTWYPIEPLEAVVFCESITYSPDPVATLQRYVGYLAPGGVAIVSMYRNGQAVTIGRKLEKAFPLRDQTSAVHSTGKRWDIRLFSS
jgi:2-polyprenyl-6-hydroxyphenyl methylase/3-demethylubiquinone-9 3-methyltransferase